MKEIRDLLDRHLRQRDLDLVDIIEVPQHGDKMVRNLLIYQYLPGVWYAHPSAGTALARENAEVANHRSVPTRKGGTSG